ncbi:DNA cytosine methyltransferase [Leifsonia shinshuensis]|uniref:Cytosine-specific methyltransferase n=1 Tax=Leifsonia shinshuensis TaxID=150026 RepID=A0A853CWV5_9MICO|nr:DNA cytosine methyltransferase [Leifsonia shinshuensis]NYJ23045.1 DNA (cytosine-5)-methyltransferase 1 [Leifsonia shinshuensis]
MSALKALSLFSGAGGMDIGVERAGFEIVGSVELDPRARAALHLNRPWWPSLGDGDVLSVAKSLTPESLSLGYGDLDLVVGGPPCQPFSTAAQWSGGRLGMDDVRAKTVHGTLDVIETLAPKVVILENVLGFVQGSGAALPFIKQRLETLADKRDVHYNIDFRNINAADYGVPQNRKRVIVVLVRKDSGSWSWPTLTHSAAPATAWDALHDLQEHDPPTPQGRWAGLLPSIPEGWNYQWHTARGGGEELFGYRTKYWNFLLKLAKDRPSWTLAASPGPSTGPFHWDNRPLSSREMMRLQTFPDEWTLPGDYRAQVKLIGNATPSLLAEVMARAAAQTISGSPILGSPTLEVVRSKRPATSSPVAQVPVAYLHLLGAKDDHPGTGLGPGAQERSDRIRARLEQLQTTL